jgi:hypothetical protein
MLRSGQPHGDRHTLQSYTPTRYRQRWHASNGVIVIGCGCPCRKERYQEMGNRQGRLRAEGIKLRYFKESYVPEEKKSLTYCQGGRVYVYVYELAFELGVNDGIIRWK